MGCTRGHQKSGRGDALLARQDALNLVDNEVELLVQIKVRPAAGFASPSPLSPAANQQCWKYIGYLRSLIQPTMITLTEEMPRFEADR
jgi:hypothetical protein